MRDLGSIVKFMKSRRNPAPDPDPDNPWYCTDDEFLVEEKLDGERLCLHKRGNEYFYFSRCASRRVAFWVERRLTKLQMLL